MPQRELFTVNSYKTPTTPKPLLQKLSSPLPITVPTLNLLPSIQLAMQTRKQSLKSFTVTMVFPFERKIGTGCERLPRGIPTRQKLGRLGLVLIQCFRFARSLWLSAGRRERKRRWRFFGKVCYYT